MLLQGIHSLRLTLGRRRIVTTNALNSKLELVDSAAHFGHFAIKDHFVFSIKLCNACLWLSLGNLHLNLHLDVIYSPPHLINSSLIFFIRDPSFDISNDFAHRFLYVLKVSFLTDQAHHVTTSYAVKF
jgi:hypothetical protein